VIIDRVGPGGNRDSIPVSIPEGRGVIPMRLRNDLSFHCPASFLNVVKHVLHEYHGPIRVVEVGGFTGDCVLWADSPVDGEHRVRSLEIEPHEAVANLRRTLGWLDAESRITVRQLAMSNFSGWVRHSAGEGDRDYTWLAPGKIGEADACDHGVEGCLEFSRLDVVMQEWAGDEVVDVLRIKANGFELDILSGLGDWRHKVRWILVFCDTPEVPQCEEVIGSWFVHHGRRCDVWGCEFVARSPVLTSADVVIAFKK